MSHTTTQSGSDHDRTPAQLYALTFGAVLLLIGIVGFLVNSKFNSGDNVRGDDLIIFEVNGWHNIVHIASGLLGLALWKRRDTARAYALGFGAVYLIVTIWGFVDGNDVLSIVSINTEDNFLHLAISVLGLAAGLASPADNRDARVATAR